ncbi:WSC domain-containing protein [Phyllosticta citrichinensis]
MHCSWSKVLLSAQALFGFAAVGNAQQYAGSNISSTLPLVPGTELAFFNIKSPKSQNTTLINYASLNSTNNGRPDPKKLKRAVIVLHGLNRDPQTYISQMTHTLALTSLRLVALNTLTVPGVNQDTVGLIAPYFANGDDKNTGYYPWVNNVSVSSAIVWKGSQWASGQYNQYPSSVQTISSYAVIDQIIQYFDNKAMFPNLNQRHAEVSTVSSSTPVVYWIGNPNSWGWLSTDRPLDYSSCVPYDDWRDGLNAYPTQYNIALVNTSSGIDRAGVLANYRKKNLAYARGLMDFGDDASNCAPGTTGANRNERFFNFIARFPQPAKLNTIDYTNCGHDSGCMFASPAGQARLFLDNFSGNGSKAYDFGYPRQQAGDDPYPDPKQNSTVSSANAGTYNGMTYQGCWTDQTPSTLSVRFSSGNNNSIETCTAACSAQGYKIAGLENGADCWCGNTIGYKAFNTTDRGCTLACSGNSKEICGDANRLSLFSSGPMVQAITPSSPKTAGNFGLVGCYSDSPANRGLTGKSTSVSSMTVENCASFCAGYMYFGVEYGQECYCANNVGCSSTVSLSANCNMQCASNSTQYCGGNGFLNLYALPSAPSPSSTNCSATTTSSGSAASSTATGLSCPSSNGVVYNTTMGSGFVIECYTDRYAGDMGSTTTSSFEDCIAACDAASGCVDVSYVLGACYLKSSAGAPQTNNNVFGARLIARNGTYVSSATTTSASGSNATASATSALSTSSAVASASPITCPSGDGSIYTAANNKTFVIECGVDHAGGDLGAPTYPYDFGLCINQCASTTGCVDVSFNGGPCYMKGSVGAVVSNAGIWGARLFAGSSGIASSSSAPASASPTVTPASNSNSNSSSSLSPSVSSAVVSSTSTPTASATPAALPSGVVSLGCYVDTGNPHPLPTQIYGNSSNTPALCASACRAAGYQFAGTQYSSECWCGNTLPATNTSLSDCSMTCSGDSAQKCGAGYRISVAKDTTWTPSFFARASYGTWSLAACYVDGANGARTLPSQIGIDVASATVAKCLDACAAAGFAVCGAEYYHECWAGANLPASALLAPGADALSAGCDYPCAGNSTEACGGANRVLVYVNNGTAMAANSSRVG